MPLSTNIQRNTDLITGSEDLEHLFTIPNFPVFMGQTEQDSNLDLTCDLGFYISRGSGMVQLNPLVPLDILYHSSHSSGKIGTLWADHHKLLADFIKKHNPKKVYEIGGGHGLLSQHFINKSVDWTIVDPNSERLPGVSIINGFFNAETSIPNTVDMFVHSHVLEHIYDPGQFFKLLSTLNIGTKMCFSIPNLAYLIKNKHLSVLHFEHTYLCIEEYVEWWLSANGFRILEKHFYLDHSIFYATERAENIAALPIPKLYETNKLLFKNFFNYYNVLIQQLNYELDKTDGAYLFGGHIFSQFLLAIGLREDKIKGILDNDPMKQGKRLYGTKFLIESPACLSNVETPLVIVKTGIYDKEIKEGLLKTNPDIVFLD
jgi:hypothetical protein